jgi:hypothetical protein
MGTKALNERNPKDVIVPIYVYFISIYFDLKPTDKNRVMSVVCCQLSGMTIFSST